MPGKTLSSSWGLEVDWLIRYLQKYRVSATEMQAAVTSTVKRPRGNYLPVDEYLHLFAWAAVRLKAPHIGLDIARQLSTQDLGIYGYLIQNTPTLASMVDVIVRYQSIFMQGMRFSTINIKHETQIEWRIFKPFDDGVRQDVEFTLAAFLRMIRLKLGEAYNPIRVNFRHPASDPVDDYRKYFGADVHFNQEVNNLILDRSDMSIPLADSDPDLLAILMEQANQRLAQASDNKKLTELAKLHIAATLHEGLTGLECLASSLNCTGRTLERHLAREKTSYKRLREQVMLEIACEALSCTNASIETIASRLGYSESSAFVRAFKRLTGTTPMRFRSNMRDGSLKPARSF